MRTTSSPSSPPARVGGARAVGAAETSFPHFGRAGVLDHLAQSCAGLGAVHVLAFPGDNDDLTPRLAPVSGSLVVIDPRPDSDLELDVSDPSVTRVFASADQDIDDETLARAEVVVASYALHGIPTGDQVRLIRRWASNARTRLVLIGGVGFPSRSAFDAARLDLGRQWAADQHYICGDELTTELELLGLRATWTQLSPCAGALRVWSLPPLP